MDGHGQQRADGATQGRRPLAQHSLACLLRDFEGPDGRIPSGSVATILETFEDGAAYLVGFDPPLETPEFVRSDMLEPYDEPV